MQQPESKHRSFQPFCDRCTKADEEILVSVSPKYLTPGRDNPNDMVLKNRNRFPVYFKACATNMNAFEPQPMTGRISPLGNTTITIPFYASATPIRRHEEVIILISQRPFFLPEGNACRFCFKPHDIEKTEHIAEYAGRTLGEMTSHKLADSEKKTTFTCKNCNSQIQAYKDVTAKREGSNVEYKEQDITFIDAEAEKKTKGRQVGHHRTCKAHQKDMHKMLPVHSSSSDQSDKASLCLSADDIQSQKFYFSGDYCQECSGPKIPTKHIDTDQMNQQYRYKFYPMHSSISEQAGVICSCTATERTKAQDVALGDSRSKSHSVKHDAGGVTKKKQMRYGTKHEKKVVTDLPGNVQDRDGSNCYCNKRAHIQARVVKARDNNAVADEDSSTISSEDSKREKRIRIISERVITKHEKVKKEQKDSFESATGCKLSSEKPPRPQRKRNAMVLELDKKCTQILNMSQLTFMMILLLMAIVLGLIITHCH